MNTIPVIDSYTWAQFGPSMGLAGAALILLMIDAFAPRFPRRGTALIAGLVALVAGLFQVGAANYNPYGALACIAGACCLFMAFDYTRVTCASVGGDDCAEGTGEFYILPLIAMAGISVMTQARDLVMLFVGLEVLTLSSYVLAGYYRRNQGSIEAGVKYIVVGGVSTAILVFGAAWYYGMTGSFMLSTQAIFMSFSLIQTPIFAAGLMMALALLIVGTAFKVGLFPMQLWIPDVYQGSPTPITGFLAVASKTAGLSALCSILFPLYNPTLSQYFPGHMAVLMQALCVMAALTLCIGNLGALIQNNAKRLMAYSSIGQAGFILIFFISLSSPPAVIAAQVFNYLMAYGVATLGVIAFICLIRDQRGSEEISAFRGLGKTNPRSAFAITVFLASLAGVPLSVGFLVKMSSFMALINASEHVNGILWLLPIMVLTAAAGFYYYFKIMRAMYWERPEEGQVPIRVPLLTGIMATLFVLVIIGLGTAPFIWK